MPEWKLVPVEPTPEMIEDMANAILSDIPIREIYSDMLAAAPSPKWVPVSERLPTREDADEAGAVWAFQRGGELAPYLLQFDWLAALPASSWAIKATHWMPKPRQQPPEPPCE